MTSFLFSFLIFFLRETTLLKEKQLFSKGNNSAQREKKTLCKGMRIMLRQTVTQTTEIFLFILCEYAFHDYHFLSLNIRIRGQATRAFYGLLGSHASCVQNAMITPPRDRGGVIFSLQFDSVCVCVCLSICLSVSLSVNKIPAERMHRFRLGFRQMVAYCIGSNPIEIGDFWLT